MKSLSSLSIRGKLLFLIFVAVLPALGIILFSGLERRENEIISTKRDILHLVQSLAAQQEQVAAGTRQMLQTLAQLPEVQNIDAKACNRIFRNIHKQNPIYSTIAAATPDGNMFAASAPFTTGSVNLADRKHIRDAIRTRNFSAGEYIMGRVSRVPSINYTYPVLDENGKLIAVIIAGIKLDRYKEFMAQVNLPEGSVMGIADYKNITLYRFPEHKNIPPGTPIPLKYFQGIPVSSKEGFYEGIGLDNVSRIYAYKRLWLRDNESPYLTIYVGVDKNLGLHQANIELVYNLVSLGIACLLAMLLAWITGNSIIVEPLNKLVMATQRFGEGELHIRTDIPRREDELGRLAKSFDTMAAMLEKENLERKKAKEALRESEENFRTFFNTVDDMIIVGSPDGKIIYTNPAMTLKLGYSPDEFKNMHTLDVHPASKRQEAEVIFAAMFKGEQENCPLPLAAKSGALIPVETRV
ncbi:MAG: PAS domain S-box protein, partial [Syntrophus sp. (in: bacteria)]